MTGPRRTRLRIPTRMLGAINKQGWEHFPLETGGILLGHTGRNDIVVTHVIGPGPEASHERYGFTPDDTWQADQVARAWAADHSTEYLGDWHTHPNGRPHPSPLDRRTLASIATHEAARQPTPTMLIAALWANGSTEIRAMRSTGRRIRRLQVTVDQVD